jgi:hypothetical protein
MLLICLKSELIGAFAAIYKQRNLDINIERVDTQIFRDKKDDEVVVVE